MLGGKGPRNTWMEEKGRKGGAIVTLLSFRGNATDNA